MIRFEDIEQQDIPKFRGGTGVTKARMFVDDYNKIAEITLQKDVYVGEHKHEVDSEVVYVLSGIANCVLDGEEEIVTAGQIHYCPKGHTHYIYNCHDEDLVMYCVIPRHE